MNDDALSLRLRIDGEADADAQALDEAAARLREQLLELDVRAVEPLRSGEAPPGTRAAEAIVLGSLLVTMARSPEVLKRLVGGVQDWLTRDRSRAVELQIGGDTLKVSGVSSAEQRRLIDLFVERHGR